MSGANTNEVELLSWIPEEFSHSGSGSTALFLFYFFGNLRDCAGTRVLGQNSSFSAGGPELALTSGARSAPGSGRIYLLCTITILHQKSYPMKERGNTEKLAQKIAPPFSHTVSVYIIHITIQLSLWGKRVGANRTY